MKRLIAAVVAALLIMASDPPEAKAIWVEGSWLSDACLSTERTNETACLSYVMGIVDMLSVDRKLPSQNFPAICLPETGTINGLHLHRLVTAYVRGHPEEQNEPAVLTVLKAIKDVFPCS